MKIIGAIPARFASVRFPGKPLFEIAGKPLLQWVIEGTQKSRLISEIVVATDNLQIADLAKKCGVEAVMTSPDLASGSDRVWAAVKDRQFDVVLNIQGDEPFVTGDIVDKLSSAFVDSPAGAFNASKPPEMATLAHSLTEEELLSPNAVKVVVNSQNDALYFSRFPIPHSRHDAKSMGGKFGSLKHIGLYGFQKNFLEKFCATAPALIEKAESLEQLRALDMGARIRVIQVEEGLQGVDTPEDAEKVARLLALSTRR